MNSYLLAASLATLATCAVHSILGELLLLRHFDAVRGIRPVTAFTLVPLVSLPKSEDLSKSTVRASWHIATTLGLAIAALLARYAQHASLGADAIWAVRAIAAAFLGCALLFIAMTRFKHPACVIFSVLAILSWLGSVSAA